MRHKKRRPRIFPKLLLLIILLTVIILLDSNTRIETTEYELYYPTLPASFDGFRIVALSDVHGSQFGRDNETLIAKVEEAKPDIIAITGDFIDSYEKQTLETQLGIADSLVRELTGIAPVYYVTGNHEWDSDGLRPLLEMLSERGVTVLRNKYIRLESGGDEIILAGTDDPNGPADMISPEQLVERIYDNEGSPFIVVLEHRNNHLPLYSSLGVDLVLCGHAHGGIIRLPFTDGLIGPSREWLPTYTNGVYETGGTKMVVSRGLGNHTGFPRFLNNPHIVVAVLRKT